MSRFWQELVTGVTFGAMIAAGVMYFTGFPWGLV